MYPWRGDDLSIGIFYMYFWSDGPMSEVS